MAMVDEVRKFEDKMLQGDVMAITNAALDDLADLHGKGVHKLLWVSPEFTGNGLWSCSVSLNGGPYKGHQAPTLYECLKALIK